VSALLELAERCEQATGPDRDLDRAIELSLPGRLPHPYDGGGPAGVWANVISGEGHPDYAPGQGYSSPDYTASIDTAMKLVPECEAGGQWWNLNHGTSTSCAKVRIYYFQSSRYDEKPPREFEGKLCVTPALALCAAALRARASTSPTTTTDEENTNGDASRAPIPGE
jgi:hypothetical protein